MSIHTDIGTLKVNTQSVPCTSKYQLEVFKPFENGDTTGRYRLIITDTSKTSGYPTNFVCVLPHKFHDNDKRKCVFVQKFGYDLAYAVSLIKEAIKKEIDEFAKAELKKRLKTLSSNNNITIKREEIVTIRTNSLSQSL